MSRRRGDCCCGFACPEWVACLPDAIGLSMQYAYRVRSFRGDVLDASITIAFSFNGSLYRNNPAPEVMRGTLGSWSYDERLIEYQRDPLCVTPFILRDRHIFGSGNEAEAIALTSGIGCFDPCQLGLNAFSRASVSLFGLCDYRFLEPGQPISEGQQYQPMGMSAVDAAARCLTDPQAFEQWVVEGPASYYPPSYGGTSPTCPPVEQRGFFCKAGEVVGVIPIMDWEFISCPVANAFCGGQDFLHFEFSSHVSVLGGG